MFGEGLNRTSEDHVSGGAFCPTRMWAHLPSPSTWRSWAAQAFGQQPPGACPGLAQVAEPMQSGREWPKKGIKWAGLGGGWGGGAPHTSQGPAKRSHLFCTFPAERTYTQQQGVVRQGREAGFPGPEQSDELGTH